jgi:hypothetical protein
MHPAGNGDRSASMRPDSESAACACAVAVRHGAAGQAPLAGSRARVPSSQDGLRCWCQVACAPGCDHPLSEDEAEVSPSQPTAALAGRWSALASAHGAAVGRRSLSTALATRVSVRVQTHTQARARAYTHARTHTSTHAHTHAHAHTHTHTQSYAQRRTHRTGWRAKHLWMLLYTVQARCFDRFRPLLSAVDPLGALRVCERASVCPAGRSGTVSTDSTPSQPGARTRAFCACSLSPTWHKSEQASGQPANHICTGTGLTPATFAPGLGSPGRMCN